MSNVISTQFENTPEGSVDAKSKEYEIMESIVKAHFKPVLSKELSIQIKRNHELKVESM